MGDASPTGRGGLQVASAAVDSDGDGLDDLDEAPNGCDPGNPDSDGDGLTDGQEVLTLGTKCFSIDSDGDVIGDAPEAIWTGTATSIGATSLTDSAQVWVTDQWAGYFLKITSGGGSANPWVRVVSNTDTVLTISADKTLAGVPWPAGNPSVGEAYRIQQHGTDPNDTCADDTIRNNERGPDFGEPLSPYMLDIDDDRLTSASDVFALFPLWLVEVGQVTYNPRLDLSLDGVVSSADVFLLFPQWLLNCSLLGPDGDGDGVTDGVDVCPTLPDDPDGVDDIDGCPDVDPAVSGANAGPLLTSYEGFPDVRNVVASVANLTTAATPVDSASADITYTFGVGANTAPAVVTVASPATATTGTLAPEAFVAVNKDVTIACSGAGSGTVDIDVSVSGLAPPGTVEEAGTAANNTDTAALNVNCLSNDPRLDPLGAASLPVVHFLPGGGSNGLEVGSSNVTQTVVNDSGGTPNQDTKIRTEWTITTPPELNAVWPSTGTNVRQHVTLLNLPPGGSQAFNATMDVSCNQVGSFSVTIDAQITLVFGGTVDPAKDKDLANNSDAIVVPVSCQLNTDGDGLLDSVDSCILVKEDDDGVDDGDGCPDIDAAVSNAAAGSTLAGHIGLPVVRGFTADVSNLTVAGVPSQSAAAAIEVTFAVTGNTAPATVSLEVPANVSTVSLAAGASEGLSRDLTVECTGLGSGTVSLSVTVSGLSPVETVEETGSGANNTDATSFPVSCVLDDPQVGPVGNTAVPSLQFQPDPFNNPAVETGSLSISQLVTNNSAGPPTQTADIQVEWTISSPVGLTAVWGTPGAGGGTGGGTTITKTTGLLGEGASFNLDNPLDLACVGPQPADTVYDVTVTGTIVAVVAGTVDLASDADTGNNTAQQIVPVTCQQNTDGDTLVDSVDPTPDHDVVASNLVINFGGVVAPGGSAPMLVSFDVTNTRTHSDVITVSLSVTGLPSGCAISGNGTPSNPPASTFTLAASTTVTVTWITTISCSSGATLGQDEFTVTAVVDHVPQLGDGDETTSQSANNEVIGSQELLVD